MPKCADCAELKEDVEQMYDGFSQQLAELRKAAQVLAKATVGLIDKNPHLSYGYRKELRPEIEKIASMEAFSPVSR